MQHFFLKGCSHDFVYYIVNWAWLPKSRAKEREVGETHGWMDGENQDWSDRR